MAFTLQISTVQIVDDVSSVNLVDNSVDSIMSLVSSSNPSGSGASVSFTCTVAGATGTVLFQIDGITAATITLSSGVAVYSTSSLAVGTHLVAAYYSGDGSNAPNSTVLAPNQVVQSAAPGSPGGFHGRSKVK